jgi:hypothetical protein
LISGHQYSFDICIQLGLGLSVCSAVWVFVVSTDSLFLKLLILTFSIFSIHLLRSVGSGIFHDTDSGSQVSNDLSVQHILLVSGCALIARGWYQLLWLVIPFIASKIFSTYLANKSLHNHRKYVLKAVFFCFYIFGILASHWSTSPMSSRFWISYDQVFRAGMATGLTRWGWTDANFGTGHSYTYHWLPEAMVGVLARVLGVSEADSVSRLFPAIGVIFAAAVLARIVKNFNLESKALLLVSFAFLILESSFSLFSVGTLWGAAIYLLAIYFFLNFQFCNNTYTHIYVFALMPFLVFLSQSPLGLSLCFGFVLHILYLTLRRKIFLLSSITSLFLLTGTILSLQQTVFRRAPAISTSNILQFDGFLNFPALPIQFGDLAAGPTWPVYLNSFVFLLFVFSTCSIGFLRIYGFGLLQKWQQMLIFQMVAALFLLNFFPLGTFSNKFLVPIQTLGLLSSLLVFFSLISFLTKVRVQYLLSLSFLLSVLATLSNRISSQLNPSSYSIFVLISVIFFFLCSVLAIRLSFNQAIVNQGSIVSKRFFAVLVIISTVFVSFQYSSTSLIRGSFFHKFSDASIVLEGHDVKKCFEFLRRNTPKLTIVATSMWRLPGLADERYVLTSLLSQRRTLVDGPVFVHINWPSKEYFENLKNVHTAFANSLDSSSRDQLVALGAEYFVLDTRFDNPDRVWKSLDNQNVVFGNSECSILKF